MLEEQAYQDLLTWQFIPRNRKIILIHSWQSQIDLSLESFITQSRYISKNKQFEGNPVSWELERVSVARLTYTREKYCSWTEMWKCATHRHRYTDTQSSSSHTVNTFAIHCFGGSISVFLAYLISERSFWNKIFHEFY